MDQGTSEYIIGGAGLSVENTTHLFDHSYLPRGFQAQALDWIHGDDTPPVAAVCAPTGGGKTDVITALADNANKLLCIYPTNALIDAQIKEFEAAGFANIEYITGDTLSGHGDDRADELLKRVQNPHDIVVTNPDILQAVIQGSYFSPGGRILEIFAQFDAVVYDEFHYYDPLAASGLLTQIKILSERGSYRTVGGKELPKFLLTSATPDKTFIECIRDDLQLNLQTFRSTIHTLDTSDRVDENPTGLIYNSGSVSETARDNVPIARKVESKTSVLSEIVEDPPDHISRFRYPMHVWRSQEWIGDCFPLVADQLAETIEAEYMGGGPVAAVIFNSAAQSNEFQEYLREARPELYKQVAKDNGYDTNADQSLPDTIPALNTTSKGEVGLNYDLKRLVMATPYTTSQFIQRIGRAARKSPAKINIYGFADPSWPSVQSYSQFLSRIPAVLPDIDHRHTQIRNLTGIRAAAALNTRKRDRQYYNEDVFTDLTGYQTQYQWTTFFECISEASVDQADQTEADSWGKITTVDNATTRLVDVVDTLRQSITALRGQSLSHPVSYPHGGEQVNTEYDLISALSHYAIAEPSTSVTDRIELTSEKPPAPLRGYYSGRPNGGDGIDLTQSREKIDQKLRNRYLSLVDSADTLSHYDLDPASIRQFIQTVPLSAAMIPERIGVGELIITCDLTYGQIESIE